MLTPSDLLLLDLLNWSEYHHAAYGTHFELIYESEKKCFRTVEALCAFFKCPSNEDLANKLLEKIGHEEFQLLFVPPADSINPFIDYKTLTEEETLTLNAIKSSLARYPIVNVVERKFNDLIAEFNKIKTPTLVDIAHFIKSMILLHPFPDGNGRVFTLCILNELLVKNKFGICLNLNPSIAVLSDVEIAERIKANLIDLKRCAPPVISSKIGFFSVPMFVDETFLSVTKELGRKPTDFVKIYDVGYSRKYDALFRENMPVSPSAIDHGSSVLGHEYGNPFNSKSILVDVDVSRCDFGSSPDEETLPKFGADW